MHFEKTMCDRLGYKYKEIFSHLDFILNKMNNLLKNYGCGLSDKELEILSQLFLKLETGQIEIIEFTRPIEKYLDVDEIYKENKELKDNWNKLKEHLTNRYNNGTESISYRQVFMEIRGAMQALEIAQELESGESNE